MAEIVPWTLKTATSLPPTVTDVPLPVGSCSTRITSTNSAMHHAPAFCLPELCSGSCASLPVHCVSVRFRLWHRRRIGLKNCKNVSFWVFDHGVPPRLRNRRLRAQHATAEPLHPFHGAVERFHPHVVHPTARPRNGAVGEPAPDGCFFRGRSLNVKVVHARSFFDLPAE